MIQVVREIAIHRELLGILAWKNIVIRYKQAYLGVLWALFQPLVMMLIFTVVRSFIGIESGDIPYPILTFAALMPWIFFQNATSDGVNSVVQNAALVRKIYFPRVVFPLASVLTKLVELGISAAILVGLMIYYQMVPTVHVFWVPAIIVYAMLVSLSISLAGAAANVFYRDVSSVLPILISLLMYASPVIYPLALVKEKLLVERAVGDWSDMIFTLYVSNPMAGIIDAFQRVVLHGQAPDLSVLWPGMVLTAILLPVGYAFFRHAEAYFADIV